MLQREEGKALVVPAHQSGLTVTVGEDGVWINLETLSGNRVGLNAKLCVKSSGPLTNDIVEGWIRDMEGLYQEAEVVKPTPVLPHKRTVHKIESVRQIAGSLALHSIQFNLEANDDVGDFTFTVSIEHSDFLNSLVKSYERG